MRLKNKIYKWALAAVLPILCLWLITPNAMAKQARLQGFAFEIGKTVERITILSSAKLVQKKAFLLDSPNRLVLDFEAFKAEQAGLPENYRGKLISSVRTGAHGKNATRIVFDLTTQVEVIASYQVKPEGALWRHVVDIKKKTRPSAANTTKPPVKKATKITSKPAKKAPQKAPAKKKKQEITNNWRGKKSVIVIDPGHGGKDPGALGSLHKEKDLTLRFAKVLKQKLEAKKRYKVLLTREKDAFLPLRKRVAFAQKHKADLFISIHADSNPNKKAKGVSVYTLSETASDEESAALAAHENSADIIDGVDIGVNDEDVADILIDLTQRETMRVSANLADVMVKHLKGKVPLVTRAHRYAGFRVLKTFDIPSILVELGFLSNKEDERRLASSKYRDLTSTALARGIDSYLRQKQR